jgi:uncharacterized membrane protein
MEKREKYSKLVFFIFFIPFFIFSLLQFIAPIALPKGSVNNLDGISAISDNENVINKMPAPWNFIYSAGDRLCHQKADRSFFINDNQMPFCARCVAIFLGITIGIGFMIFFRLQLDLKFLLLLLMGFIPIGIDGIGQQMGFWESNNLIRLITGLLIGIVSGITISIIIDEISEMFINRKKTKDN